VKDDEKRERIARLWRPWLKAWKQDPQNISLWQCGWLLMEWRVAEFAPSQPRYVKFSEKKIENLLGSVIS